MTGTQKEIVLAYRHLYQHLLRAVQYSKPARFVARDRIRNAFRSSPPEAYDPAKIATTLEFLDGAIKARGVEHRVVKNLMHVWWERQKLMRSMGRPSDLPLRRKAYDQFDQTIEKLNETMGLCIK